MPEKVPSPDSLFSQLTALSYDLDAEFKRGNSDVMTQERSSKKFAGYLVDENDEEIKIPLYNEKSLAFKAFRAEGDDAIQQPTAFTARQEIITQIGEIPKTLLPHLDPELIEQYDMTEPGDLNTVHYVDYAVTYDDGEILIRRDIGFILRDIDNVIFETSETKGQPEPEVVPIAHAQQSLRVFQPIEQDAAQDEIEQISFSAVFDEIFDGSNQLFYSEFVERRDNDTTLALLGFIKCIKGRHELPNELALPNSECEDIDIADKLN